MLAARLAAVGSVLLVASTAAGAPRAGWSHAVTVSGPGARGGQIAADARGDAVVVWIANADTDHAVIEAAFRRAGGSGFSKPKELAPPSRYYSGVDVAMDAAGDATVVWSSHWTGVWAATLRNNSLSQPPVQIGAPFSGVFSPEVAVDARGDAIAAWGSRDDQTNETIRAAFRPAGSVFGPPEKVTPFYGGGQLALAIGASGDAVVTWFTQFRSPTLVGAAYRPAGGDFETPATLDDATGTPAFFEGIDAAIDARGDATVLWTAHRGTTAVRWADRPANGEWQQARDVSDAGNLGGIEPRVGVTNGGKETAAWSTAPPRGVQASTRSFGGDWTPPVTLSAPGERAITGDFVNPAALAVARNGAAVVAWVASRTVPTVVAAIRPPSKAAFQPEQTVAPRGVCAPSSEGTVDAAIGETGEAVAWLTCPAHAVASSGYRTAGPKRHVHTRHASSPP